VAQKCWVTSVILNNLPKANYRPLGKNSPNLVTLLDSYIHTGRGHKSSVFRHVARPSSKKFQNLQTDKKKYFIFCVARKQGDQGSMLRSQFSAIFANFRLKKCVFSKTNVIITFLKKK
jgi:hypothetical protein